jgi:hypothetical protein
MQITRKLGYNWMEIDVALILVSVIVIIRRRIIEKKSVIDHIKKA